MVEASSLPASVALRAWLAAPHDVAKLASLIASASTGPVDASAITRLPAAAIAALAAAGPLPLGGLRPQVRLAALVCGLGQRLALGMTGDDKRDLDALPFLVAVSGNEVVVELLPVSHDQRFGNPFLHQWVAGIQADAVVIDCVRINHVNSVLIAWMLQMVQSARPVPVRVRRPKPQVTTQLKQLRLDHLMVIE